MSKEMPPVLILKTFLILTQTVRDIHASPVGGKFQIALFSVLVNKWWSHLCVRCLCVWKHLCACVLRCMECPCLAGQVSLGACASAAAALCVSVLFTSWPGGSGPGGDAMRALLSSLYSNDRPCCFTCCVERSVALSLQPLSKTRTQVLPVQITWVSPCLLWPSTDQMNCQEHYLGYKSITSGARGVVITARVAN